MYSRDVLRGGHGDDHLIGGQGDDRVKGGADERISVPLFFNPNVETNVAPLGSGELIRAGDHLSKRYAETYVHLQGNE